MGTKQYVSQDELLFSNECERYKQTLRLECLKLVMAHGKDIDKAEPWNKADQLFLYIYHSYKPKKG
jgi:hypothetical protein